MHFAENASVSGVHHKPTHVVRFRKRTAVFRYNQLRIASKGNLPSCLKNAGLWEVSQSRVLLRRSVVHSGFLSGPDSERMNWQAQIANATQTTKPAQESHAFILPPKNPLPF